MLPASGARTAQPAAKAFSVQGEGEDRVRSLDAREGNVTPTKAQTELAARLGAETVRWNRLGTPHVLFNRDGHLSGPRDGKAADVARHFVRQHHVLFRMSDAAVDTLTLVADTPLYDSPDLTRVLREGKQPNNPDVAHVVLFRQRFGDLDAAWDGLLTVGVQRDGRVSWVSSSVTGDTTVLGAAKLDALSAVRTAAQDVNLELGTLSPLDTVNGWITFRAARSTEVQRARMMALPTPRAGVRRVWEVVLLKGAHDAQGEPVAFISFVDAETGKVLLRDDRVDFLADAPAAPIDSAEPFSGATGPDGTCTPELHGPFVVAPGPDQITVAVAATMPAGTDDDITIKLYFGSELVADQDLLTSPEVLTYAPGGNVPAGDYFVAVCPYNAGAGSIAYSGTFVTGDSIDAQLPMARWQVFPANPNFVDSADPSADTRQVWCWLDGDGCDATQNNVASRVPWDVQAPSVPTYTTDGNNASTAISELVFVTPDTVYQRPVSPDRSYSYPWNNTWYTSACDPTTFDLPGGNDDDAATTNLFVMHNRMHDWSYHLGFTELTYNLQRTNFGNTHPRYENDPELGSAQAGRRTVNGRDNANQITLHDGIAPITNQYLWQPLAGAFYAPCADGSYDMAVVAHEYGHAISNRMVAGPDTGTGSSQGQTESWSDLMFAEYFRGFGITAGEGANPFALGPYVTGNRQRGIRNYAMNESPLNYSNIGYDGSGATSPHANSEIWSAVNFDIAEALNAKYDKAYPSGNKQLQERCALGLLPASSCPGNRRWAQLMFDGLLLNPAGSTMVDSRDAMLAADKLRFGGANERELWEAFARRGLGETASAVDADDDDPQPGWSSPMSNDEATVRFEAAGVSGGSVPAKLTIYTGHYEARISPTADTDPDTAVSDTVTFVPGTYEFIARADGYGAHRFIKTFKRNGNHVVRVPMRRNLASQHNGATAAGDGINVDKLIDDTEATNWASLTSEGTASAGKGEGAQVEGRQVTVKLGDAPVHVEHVQVSAALRPTDSDDVDSGSQSRFSALRSFDILACDATVGGRTCDEDADFEVVLMSADDAFPATRPRPTAPDLRLRGFDVKPVDATHIRLRVRDNQCTGGPDYTGAANPVNDPVFSNPDCASEASSPDRVILNPPRQQVRVAELQVFSSRPPADLPEPATPPMGPSPEPRETVDSGCAVSPSGGASNQGALVILGAGLTVLVLRIQRRRRKL